MPFFSIIIPIYNVEKYLNECVQSVLLQSFTDYECILVDDGSLDNCPKICDNYAEKYSQIKVIHKENGGLSDARNTGILQASGEYVVLLDSDDKLSDNDTLRNLFEVIQKYKTEVVINLENFTFTDNIDRKPMNRCKREIVLSSPYKVVDMVLKSGMYLVGWYFVLNKKYLLKNDLFFKKNLLHEDEHWMPRVLCKTKQIAVNYSPFYDYRILRKDSITSEVSPARLFAYLDIIADLIMWAQDGETYDENARNFMLCRSSWICTMVHDLNRRIKQHNTVVYSTIREKMLDSLKKIPSRNKKESLIIAEIYGFDNRIAKILYKWYNSLRKRIVKIAKIFGVENNAQKLFSCVRHHFEKKLEKKNKKRRNSMNFSIKFIKFRIKISTWAIRFVGWLQSGKIRRNKPKTELLKGKMLTKYFAKKYLPAVKYVEQKEVTTENPETIWQFWDNPKGQTTPEIIKSCLESTDKFKGNFEQKILNNSTIENYTDLPNFVMDKFKSGKIDYAHFADLLRLNLLTNHGGIWLDATAYMTDLVPKYILDEDFFVFLTGKMTHYPYSYIQNCFIRSKKGSFLCEEWYQMCIEFWKKETKLLDYFQHHLMFKTLVEQNPTAKKLFAQMPKVSEDGIHCLIGDNLFKKFNSAEWEKIKKSFFFQKTTYRVPNGIDYSNTYYSKLCERNI